MDKIAPVVIWRKMRYGSRIFSQKVQKRYKIQLCKSIDTERIPILSEFYKILEKY